MRNKKFIGIFTDLSQGSETHVKDFYTIKKRLPKPGVLEIYPEFRIVKSKDLMVQGKTFYERPPRA